MRKNRGEGGCLGLSYVTEGVLAQGGGGGIANTSSLSPVARGQRPRRRRPSGCLTQPGATLPLPRLRRGSSGRPCPGHSQRPQSSFIHQPFVSPHPTLKRKVRLRGGGGTRAKNIHPHRWGKQFIVTTRPSVVDIAPPKNNQGMDQCGKKK